MQRARIRLSGAAFLCAAVLGATAAPGHASIDTLRVPGGRGTSAPRAFTVAATGDILVESPVKAAAASHAAPGARYEFGPLFAPIAPILGSVDLAICHMEFPIGKPGQKAGPYGHGPRQGYRWLAPYEVAAGVRAAGYTRCTTSSNHSNDLGLDGIDSTLQALDDAGVSHVGTARSPEEAAVSTFEVKGVRVAHLAYTRANNTDRPLAWRLNMATAESIVADVNEARSQGSEVVIVSLHVGKELESAPTGADRAFVEQITKATHVDLIVLHGPHVIQPVEQVNGALVYWSVGNEVSGMGTAPMGKYADPRTLDGLMATVRFTERPDGTFRASPRTILLCVDVDTRLIYPAFATLARADVTDPLRNRIEQCIARSAEVVPDLT